MFNSYSLSKDTITTYVKTVETLATDMVIAWREKGRFFEEEEFNKITVDSDVGEIDL